MIGQYTTESGIVWNEASPDTRRPTAHVGTASGTTTADLIETIETEMEGPDGADGATQYFDLADHLLHESDELGFVTISLPVTTAWEGQLLLREIRTWDGVGYAEFQQAYLNPVELLGDDPASVFDALRSAFGAVSRQVTRLSAFVRDVMGDGPEVTADAPNDPLVSDQYGPQQMRAYEAHEALPDNDAEVKVVVLDSGIAPDHEDLSAQVAPNPGEDFQDGVGGDTDPTYPDVRGGDHGTHVSGTVLASNGNGRGTAGVAGLPNVSLQGAKIFGANPRALGQTVAEAIRWSTDEGADVINMSIGGTGQFGLPSKTVERAIEYAENNGTVCVAAAGNAGADQVDFPARHPKVVGVGAVGRNENVPRFSNRGEGVDVAAAGVRVTSTLPEDQYGDKSGTSMSSPHVAGAIALGCLANPEATPEELRRTLRDTARPVDGAGPDEVGAGIPDLVAYVNALQE
jgi:subtilisin family serine protease